jgi:hypothetical protein
LCTAPPKKHQLDPPFPFCSKQIARQGEVLGDPFGESMGSRGRAIFGGSHLFHFREQVLAEWNDTGTKMYEVKQINGNGSLLSSMQVDALSSEAAAKQLREVVDGTDRIVVCLDGAPINEMGVDYWQKRIRRR